jgi:hypothetical protein
MLTVYTFKQDRPATALDLSSVPLDELVDSASAIFTHHKTATLWFGYLDGWMLHPHEEVLLRKVIRKFDCFLISSFPLSLSQAWKNEIKTIYTDGGNGDA